MDAIRLFDIRPHASSPSQLEGSAPVPDHILQKKHRPRPGHPPAAYLPPFVSSNNVCAQQNQHTSNSSNPANFLPGNSFQLTSNSSSTPANPALQHPANYYFGSSLSSLRSKVRLSMFAQQFPARFYRFHYYFIFSCTRAASGDMDPPGAMSHSRVGPACAAGS